MLVPSCWNFFTAISANSPLCVSCYILDKMTGVVTVAGLRPKEDVIRVEYYAGPLGSCLHCFWGWLLDQQGVKIGSFAGISANA